MLLLMMLICHPLIDTFDDAAYAFAWLAALICHGFRAAVVLIVYTSRRHRRATRFSRNAFFAFSIACHFHAAIGFSPMIIPFSPLLSFSIFTATDTG